MNVELVRVAYDANNVAEELRGQGFKDLPGELENGRTRDKVAEVGAWAEGLHGDRQHAEQVRTLAVLIFDGTRGLHRLDPKDRELLEMAAMVHDVGLSEGAEGHQRRALDIVMRGELPLEEVERRMLACIARYHGMRSPRRDDKVFKGLTESERRRVAKLSAILALADGLDRGHASLVGGLEVAVGRRAVRIVVHGKGDLSLEKEWGCRKGAQFIRVFGREVIVDDRA
jgi:exopolyphosphatase/guanosine-5'-triphosphate,3'-diphosphate pyrophosphatase